MAYNWVWWLITPDKTHIGKSGEYKEYLGQFLKFMFRNNFLKMQRVSQWLFVVALWKISGVSNFGLWRAFFSFLHSPLNGEDIGYTEKKLRYVENGLA